MDTIREVLFFIFDVAACHHAPAVDDMDADDLLLLAIGLAVFFVALIVYLHFY